MSDSNWLRRNGIGATLALLLIGALWWKFARNRLEGETAGTSSTLSLPPAPLPMPRPNVPLAQDNENIDAQQDTNEELTEEERFKLIDGENMKRLHAGIFAYKEKFGEYPEYLSQLVPDFVDAEALVSPRGALELEEHADPGLEKPSYGYEFSNLEFRDGRTFAEIKDVQRSEWGDVVPMLRSFGYSDGKVLNMSYAGELYETKINWEWDPATLDLVAELGWGPGLDVGAFTEVRVVDAAGAPVAGAEVWADGRTYSFDLPNRPFATNDEGYARIPLGADLDRTALVLRVATDDGLASTAVAFQNGTPPDHYEMTVEPAQTVGGTVTDAEGQPVGDTWIYLKTGTSTDNNDFMSQVGRNLGTVKTNENGQWIASLHPDDTSDFGAVVATPSVAIPKFTTPIPVPPAEAAQGSAILVLPADGG
ncbi:MAG: hypothetical protein KDN22_15865 [Verrucomicrobiae bacterium]|nr:hypothetical protein [Verrucomicrobiae bacterium]